MEFKLYDFNVALYNVILKFCPWIKFIAIEKATYYYLLNLIEKSKRKQELIDLAAFNNRI